MKKYSKKEKKQYALGIYKATKNSVKVTYNGVEYLSKKQACVLNDLDIKELNKYLENGTNNDSTEIA